MANPFYAPGEQRGPKVYELFTRIAPRYDLINDLQSFGLHRWWKRQVIRLAQPEPGKLALDLCCGTGDLALMLADQGAEVVGLDFSDQMLAVAQRRNQNREKSAATHSARSASASGSSAGPRFVQGDALRLPFPDRSFDIVTIGYGLRNLAGLKSGLSEMRRVARPGARLVVLDFGKPDNALWRGCYFAYLKVFVPLLGLAFCGSASAYAYILESLIHYPAQREVARQMTELGMRNVSIINFLGGVTSINYGENSS